MPIIERIETLKQIPRTNNINPTITQVDIIHNAKCIIFYLLLKYIRRLWLLPRAFYFPNFSIIS